MATAKKGKKTSKPKKGSKSRKKSKNSNFFTKFILILLVLAMIVTAVFLTLNNFNTKDNKTSQDKKEIVAKKDKNTTTNKTTNKTATKLSESKKEDDKKENANSKKETKKESQRVTNLSGCWLSSEQGTFITLDQYGYRIDFSNVDVSKPLTGNYYIENNLITFTTDGNECKGLEGTYRITFYKKNFSLICKDDECTSRRNILEADWEWVEI